jgi:hypothetical protein
MINLGFFVLFCLAALLVAWVVNMLVNVLSGEKRDDTGSLWSDILLRLYAVKEFGIVARILNYTATHAWPLKVLYAMGVIGILALLVRVCRD